MYISNLEKLVDDFFLSHPTSEAPTFFRYPEKKQNHEFIKTKDGAILMQETPGFNKNNLKVELEDGTITILGNTEISIGEQKLERTFNRSFRVSKEYDLSNIEAKIEDGLLTIILKYPKKETKTKKITLI